MEPTVKEGAALLARATGWLSWIAANWRKPAAVMVVTGGIAGGVTEFGHYAGGLAEFYKLVYEWVYVPIHGPVPAETSAANPLTLSVASDAVRPIDGHQAVTLPSVGVIYPGGAIVRVAMQSAKSANVEVHRLILQVEAEDSKGHPIVDRVDPLKQAGFGSAQPRMFYIIINDATHGRASFVRDDGRTAAAKFPDLLPGDGSFLFVFDPKSGSQEALDFTIKLVPSGLFKVSFKATGTCDGKDCEASSGSVMLGNP